MADFKTPNLCGANESLNNASSKIEDLISELDAKVTSLPSEAAAALNTKFADVKAGLDGLAKDLPETPNTNLQSEITSLINNIDRTTVEGISAYNAKVAQLQLDFGDALKEKGLELDKLISDSSKKLGKDISAATTALDGAVSGVTDALSGAISDVTGAVSNAVSGVTGAVDNAVSGLTSGGTPGLDAFGPSAITTPDVPAGGNICDLVPNFEIPAGNSGTGVTIEEIEERASNATTLTLTQIPKEIIEVQGKKTTQQFFTNIQYTQNGKVIVPKATGTYETIKVLYTISLIKEKPIAAKQADVPAESEEVSIVTTNVSSVENKTTFKLNNLFKKLDNLSVGGLDTTKANADISSALSAIKSPEFKAKMQSDFDYATKQRKKLLADPLNYKQVTFSSSKNTASNKAVKVKVDTVETQNTTTTTKVETSGGNVTEVKKTEKATVSDKGFTHRQVRIKRLLRRTGFTMNTSMFVSVKKQKYATPKNVAWMASKREVEDVTFFTLKQTPVFVEKVVARSYKPDGTYGLYTYGSKKFKDTINPDYSGTGKAVSLTYVPTQSSFPSTLDFMEITYLTVEKIDPNYSG